MILLVSIAASACMPMGIDGMTSITFDGQDYLFERPGRALTLDESHLLEIGDATAVNHPLVDGTTVTAIEGIDPGAAVAMRGTPGARDELGARGEIVVFYVGEYPAGLCRYEKEHQVQPVEGC